MLLKKVIFVVEHEGKIFTIKVLPANYEILQKYATDYNRLFEFLNQPQFKWQEKSNDLLLEEPRLRAECVCGGVTVVGKGDYIGCWKCGRRFNFRYTNAGYYVFEGEEMNVADATKKENKK